ncbi:MAG: shikimate dehydrogenase [Pseudomonadota bacterium]
MTSRVAVIGWPVNHSRSPLIHTYWLDRYGIDASYGALAIEPDKAPDWFGTFAKQGLVGANVTIPHKQVAFDACHTLDERASRLGAVNTLWLEAGALRGTSTDGAGFMAHLVATAPQWRQHAHAAAALVLGAGGAARAIVEALAEAGVETIIIANRTAERAHQIATHFAEYHPQHTFKPVDLATAGDFLPTVGLLVNTTSMGMAGHPALDLDLATLPEKATVYDIVYTPLETPLLADARALGLVPVDGLGMLLHQAAPAFERWFGILPEVTDELRQMVIDDLNR